MSATMWKQYTDEYILEPQKKSPASISEVLQNGDVKLLELMEYLGSSLTNTDLSTRGRATKLIADVLHLLPTNHLSSQEVAVLCRFLSEKLSDHHSIQPPALHGIVALATYVHLPDGSAELICRQIFKEVQNQSLSQADRRNVYTIINILLESKLEEIKPMGSDFVHGYIQTMDAEKDPRNLIIAFQIAKKVIINFSLGVFVEEMFEVVSCYFPVSFSPPPDNPHGITKEDLVLSLRACLAATPQFGEFCLPLLLEKLTSEIQSAKIDALETLTDCASVYGTSALKEYTSSFYSCIRKEVMEGDSHEVKAAALKCLSAIITSLSCDITTIDSPSVLKSYIEEILAEYKIYLLKSDVKILYSSSCLVHCICSVNSIACCIVLNTVVSSILLQYNNQTQIMCRRALIAILSQFIIHASNHEDKLVSSILNSHKSELIKTYTQLLAARDKDTCVLGIQGLAAIFRCKNMLTEVEADELGNHLLRRVLSSDDEKIRHETVSSLKILSSKFISVVTTSILPKLIQDIRHEKMVVEGDYHPSADEILQIMADISNQYDLIKIVSLLIIDNLRNFKDSACTKETLTSCLCTMITNNQKSNDIIKLFVDDILPNTTNILSLCMFNKEEIGNLAKVYRIITTQVDNRKAVALAEEMVSLLLLVHSQQTAKNAGIKEENTLIPIITAVICSLPKSETVPRKAEVVNVLLQIAMEIDNSEISENCIKCLAGLVNKLPEPDVSDTMNQIEEFLKPLVTSQSTNNSSSVLLLAWITKALVLRNHPTGKNYFEKCIELLSSSVGDQVSHGFGIILTEYEDILNKVMKADIKMFYQQRLFVEHCGKIVEGYTESESTKVKKNFLVALSHLIKPLPKHVFLSELPPLLPLLIHSLDYEDKNLLVLTLATIQTLLDDEPGSAIVCQHLDTIIPQLLKLSQYQKDMKIRIAALICLAGISRQPVHFILPYRTSIVRSLLPALDDRKRLVRKEAVNARTSWFLIAEPGS